MKLLTPEALREMKEQWNPTQYAQMEEGPVKKALVELATSVYTMTDARYRQFIGRTDHGVTS